jgi:hypothetical protein
MKKKQVASRKAAWFFPVTVFVSLSMLMSGADPGGDY